MVELLMNQSVGNLLVGRNVGFEIGVDENVAVGLDERFVAKEEGPVLFGDIVHAIGAIGIERFLATPHVDPVSEVSVINAGEDELFFVVAAEEVDVEALFLLDEKVDHLLGVRAAINVVTHEDNVVFGLGGEGFPEGEERLEATVDITDGKCSHEGSLLAESEVL